MEVTNNVKETGNSYDMKKARIVAAYMGLTLAEVLKMDPATVVDTARVFSAGADTNSGEFTGGTK